jgi:hypothetical protein
MILKLSIVGLFIVLVVVLTVTYYTQLEGFIASKSAASVVATSGELLFTCAANTDIRGGNGNGTIYKASSNGRGGSVISKVTETTATATTMVSDCSCLKLGTNLAANVMMCTPATDDAVEDTPAAEATRSAAAATRAAAVATRAADAAAGTPEETTAINAAAAAATRATAALTRASEAARTASTASTAANPQRNDVQSQVAMSNTSYDAMALKQKSDLLSSIQKMFRNELLANRSTDASVIDKTTSTSSTSSSTQQGNEFNKASQKCDGPSSDEDSYRCPKNPDGSCPPVPDMTQYIKKDAIPCWGCSVDY